MISPVCAGFRRGPFDLRPYRHMNGRRSGASGRRAHRARISGQGCPGAIFNHSSCGPSGPFWRFRALKAGSAQDRKSRMGFGRFTLARKCDGSRAPRLDSRPPARSARASSTTFPIRSLIPSIPASAAALGLGAFVGAPARLSYAQVSDSVTSGSLPRVTARRITFPAWVANGTGTETWGCRLCLFA